MERSCRPGAFPLHFEKSRRFKIWAATVLLLACAAIPSNACASKLKTKVTKGMLSVNVHGLAKKVNQRVESAYPFDPDGMMWLNGEPQRLRCTFDEDSVEKDVLYGERQIIVYPLSEYRKLFTKKDQLKEFDKRVNNLKLALKAGKTDRDEIAILPSIDACQLFRAQVRFLQFKNGSGVRFVSRYATDVSPTTGRNIFYTFQGLTSDQKYWISVFYPVRTAQLTPSSDDKVSRRLLDAVKPSKFKPDLDVLDALVRSLKISY